MFDDFLTWHSARYTRRNGAAPAASTLVSTAGRLRGVMQLAEVESPTQLGTLISDRAQVVQLLDRMYAKQAPGTVRTALVSLRHFGEYAKVMGWADQVAIEPDDAPKNIPQRPIRTYTQEDLDRLLLFAKARRSLRYWMFLATVIETGRRVSEILHVRYADMYLDAEPPHFDLPTTKNKRQQYVPLPRMLRDQVWTPAHIEKLQTEGDRRIADRIALQPFPWHYQTAQDKLRRVCEVADVEYRGYHAFRHTKATEMLARGVPIHAVSALLGHANVITTDRTYSHVTALDFTRYIDSEDGV